MPSGMAVVASAALWTVPPSSAAAPDRAGRVPGLATERPGSWAVFGLSPSARGDGAQVVGAMVAAEVVDEAGDFFEGDDKEGEED